MKELNKTKILNIPILGDVAVSLGRTLFGIVLGLIASGILIAFSGVNPFVAYGSLIRGAFGNVQSISNVLVRSSPLLLGGIGVSLGIKAGVWNLGMEGYMLAQSELLSSVFRISDFRHSSIFRYV